MFSVDVVAFIKHISQCICMYKSWFVVQLEALLRDQNIEYSCHKHNAIHHLCQQTLRQEMQIFFFTGNLVQVRSAQVAKIRLTSNQENGFLLLEFIVATESTVLLVYVEF